MNTIRHGSLILAIALAALLWTGCGSPVPISDAADATAVPELVGHWQTLPGEEEGEMLVLKFDAHTYYAELREAGTEPFDEDTIRLRAFISEVEGSRIINAQNIDSLDDEDRLYFFYAYDLGSDGLLTLTELQSIGDQDIDKFETSEALYAFIQQNIDNEALYGESFVMMRVNQPG